MYRKSGFKKKRIVHENTILKSSILYLYITAEISVLPKKARSDQIGENSHSFFNVSYTLYKSMVAL